MLLRQALQTIGEPQQAKLCAEPFMRRASGYVQVSGCSSIPGARNKLFSSNI